MADSATPKTEPSKPQSWPGHGSSTVPVQQFSLIVSMDSVENVNFLTFFCGFDGSVFGVAEAATPKTDTAQVLQLCTKLAWTWLKHCACAAIFLYCFNGFS